MERITHIPQMPARAADSHKGTYGTGLVLGGCEGMAGAAAMCAQAALRSGAGLIVVGVPRSLLPVMAVKTTCATLRGFPETEAKSFAAEAVDEVVEALENATAAALGPGIGRHGSTARFVLDLVPRFEVPAVIDADGLNNLGGGLAVLRQRRAPLILTPHPGEMGRLAGMPTRDVQRDRECVAATFAQRYGVVVVLKGHETVVTDGTRVYTNTTGNPGMATGGAGDVLTGVILGLLCQGVDPFDAAVLGTWIHGSAGDLAARERTEISMIATDILECLPRAFKMHRAAAANTTSKESRSEQ